MHTPGPWHLFNKNGVIAIMKSEPCAGQRSKEIVQWGGFDASSFPRQNEANARLIAAAPDMLKALREIDGFAWTAVTADCETARKNLNRKLAVVRAAIAKAIGNNT